MRRLGLVCLLAGCEAVFPLEATSPPDAAFDGPVFPGLVARYRLELVTDELSTPDASGHQLDGECAGTRCATVTPGRHDDALQFDGVDDHFRIAPDPAFSLPAFTIALWIRIDRKLGLDAAISYPIRGSAEAGIQLYYDNAFGHGIVFATLHAMNSTNTTLYEVSPDIEIGDWHHVAGSWDGTTKVMYFDGAPIHSQQLGPLVIDNQASIAIGADVDNNIATQFLGGALDDVQIYDHALTETEILELAK